MRFGLYFHVPYCLQKCHYCDFTTFDLGHAITMPEYVQLLISELHAGAKHIPEKIVTSIYFGGGTPSLLPVGDILTLMKEVANAGFEIAPDAEVSIEINPGTLDREKLDLYLAAGINRFSVGVQTFNDSYLRACGREHSAEDSRKTLALLAERNVNYSFDLLFGLPHQSLADLDADLAELVRFSPPHVSLYNLTVPTNHKMNAARAPEEEQAEMFDLIDRRLRAAGILRYELSNFARPGYEAQHNNLYWSDHGYWGLGISAHSYLPTVGEWGLRFWNSTAASQYALQARETANEVAFYEIRPQKQREALARHESLTDFCHTHLRVLRGVTLDALEKKYGLSVRKKVHDRLEKLKNQGLLEGENGLYRLSAQGRPVANQVFLALTFLADDI